MIKISLYKRRGTNNWWVRYRDANGRLHRRSTGTADEQLARRMAARLERELLQAMVEDEERMPDDTPRQDLASADLTQDIARIEQLLVTAADHQAQAQKLAAKRVADLLRNLASRTRQLEQTLHKTGKS